MKIVILISTISIIFSTSTLSQIQSSPVVHPKLYSKYKSDVHNLTVERVNKTKAKARKEVIIPREYYDTIWWAMAAVYNAYPVEQRDIVFDPPSIRHNYLNNRYVTNTIMITSWSKKHNLAWRNNLSMTGDRRLDTLLSQYGFEFQRFRDSRYFPTAVYKTKDNINTPYLCKKLRRKMKIRFASMNSVYGSDRKIIYSTDSENYYLSFYVMWGDCPSGCQYSSSCTFRITKDFKVFVINEANDDFGGLTFKLPKYYSGDSPAQFYSVNSINICDGDSIYIMNSWHNTPLSFNDTIHKSNGEDSIVYNILSVIDYDTTFLSCDICEDSTFVVFGDTLTESGNYIKSTISDLGCDSIINLNLNIHDNDESVTYEDSICEGGRYSFNDTILSTSGRYSYITKGFYGCDKTVNLDLKVLPIPQIKFSEDFPDTICYSDEILDIHSLISPDNGLFLLDRWKNIKQLDPKDIPEGKHWLHYYYFERTPGCNDMDSIKIIIIDDVGQY